MRYAFARRDPEVLDRRKTNKELIQTSVDKVLTGINRIQDLSDGLYRKGARAGFFYGLICGALSIAILAVVVLGDVIAK